MKAMLGFEILVQPETPGKHRTHFYMLLKPPWHVPVRQFHTEIQSCNSYIIYLFCGKTEHTTWDVFYGLPGHYCTLAVAFATRVITLFNCRVDNQISFTESTTLSSFSSIRCLNSSFHVVAVPPDWDILEG